MAAPVISSVTAYDSQILIKFDQPVLALPASLLASNYTITPPGLDAVTVEVVSVATTANTDERLVETTDFTGDKTYTVTIAAGSVHNGAMQPIAPPGNTDTFTSTTTSPVVQRVYATSTIKIRVEFSKEMAIEDLEDHTKYQFDNGLRVIKAEIISNTIVELTTSKQTPSMIYTLEIVP
jgi:hypothetical protein